MFKSGFFRMADWLLAAIFLAVLVFALAPHQLPVSVYKLSLIALAAVAGYWVDRSLFPYARPDVFLSVDEPPVEEDGPEGGTLTLGTLADPVLPRLMAAAMLRRAIIVAAAMIAVGLGA